MMMMMTMIMLLIMMIMMMSGPPGNTFHHDHDEDFDNGTNSGHANHEDEGEETRRAFSAEQGNNQFDQSNNLAVR